MKTITSTKILTGYGFSSTMEFVVQVAPVKLTCTERPDIVLVKASDYENMKLELEQFQWIDVNDALPPDATWVLITADSEGCNKKISTMAFHERTEYDDCVEHYWLCQNDTKNLTEWEGVTHWMPLPKASK